MESEEHPRGSMVHHYSIEIDRRVVEKAMSSLYIRFGN